MKSPPNALPFSTVPLNVQALFERAFLQQHVTKRPSASEWHAHLKSLKDDLFKCAKNDGHYFPSQLPHCPWCEQESKGIVFFTCPIRGARTAQTIQQQSLTLDLQIVNDLEHILLALNSVLQFAVPTVGPIIYNVPPMIKQSHRIHKYVKGCSIIAIFCTCLGMLGSFAGFTDLILWLWWLLSATGGSSYIRALKRSESQASDLHQQFNTSEQKFHAVKNLHMRTHGMSISSAIEDLDDYKNLPKKMNDELKAMSQNKRVYQEMAFLKQYAIDTCPVAGIGAQRKSQLRSFGIETAYDIEKSIITSLPGFGQTLCDSLLKWRASLLKQFRFDANKQITNFERDAVLRRYQQTAAALLKKLKAHKAKLVIAEPLITLDLQKPIDTINAIAPKLSHARAEANALSRL
jgi:DNA-binding helix-hairpin-helix protein with protein kinase domain